MTAEHNESHFILGEKEADNISSAVCQIFHEKEIDIGWMFKEEPPTFCGVVTEVLECQETDKEFILKLRLNKLKGRVLGPSERVGCCVIIGEVW